MKKILKILGILIVLFLFIIGTTLTWLFSSSGNEFLKNKITQIANEKAPIGLEFTHFKLGFSKYAFSITDKQNLKLHSMATIRFSPLTLMHKFTQLLKT